VRRRGRLFRKYVALFVTLVSGALLASGLIEIYFSYQENKAALVAVQREKATGAASRIEQFVREVERQIGWTTQPVLAARGNALDQRRFDFLRLLRQVPAITEVSHLDASGREQLRVSRLAMDVVGSQADFSRETSRPMPTSTPPTSFSGSTGSRGGATVGGPTPSPTSRRGPAAWAPRSGGSACGGFRAIARTRRFLTRRPVARRPSACTIPYPADMYEPPCATSESWKRTS